MFEDAEHLGFVTMPGAIDSVSPVRLADLDPSYQEWLRGHHADMPTDPPLTEVRFHI